MPEWIRRLGPLQRLVLVLFVHLSDGRNLGRRRPRQKALMRFRDWCSAGAVRVVSKQKGIEDVVVGSGNASQRYQVVDGRLLEGHFRD